MNDIHYIEMRPVWAGGKAGYRYDLHHDGVLIASRTAQPPCDAARFLSGLGKGGKVALHRPGGPPCLFGEISRYAMRNLAESDKGGLHYQKWKPFDSASLKAGEVAIDE
jgi:hypothetical protein